MVPVISGIELFVDSSTSSYDIFVLGFFYVLSIRYTIAVALGVFAHQVSLRKLNQGRSGLALWICFFLVLVLCSLLVPGATIFGKTVTLILAVVVLFLSLAQGILSKSLFDPKQNSDTRWRILLDILLILLLFFENFYQDTASYQAPFFTICILFAADFVISESATKNFKLMRRSLATYFKNSWNRVDTNRSA